MTLPTIAPLPLIRRSESFNNADYIFELKHDGFRGVAYIEADHCQLRSRNNTIFKRFDPLCHALGKLRVKNAIIDGEIICLDDEGISLFNQLMFRRGVQYFYAFDLPWLNGMDLRQQPLLKRKERLKKLILRAKNPALLYADHIDEFGIDFFRMICEKNLEGIIAKRRDSFYDRSAKWIKIKNPVYTQAEGRSELFQKTTGEQRRPSRK
jgi:bifunctional non-homologous end joining protein LigD